METLKARILARRDTTENWNRKRSFIPIRGEVIIYMDAGHMENDQGETIDVPGIKIGDGLAYLIDLPFVGDDAKNQILSELQEHIGNTSIHVTQENREFWNNKLNYEMSGETLILNRL
jgi:hypothetical protein